MTVKNVTTDDFKAEVLNSDTPVLVDFWAAWCGPCLAMAPVLESFAEDHEGAITVAKINVDENPEIAQLYRITSIPALKVFQGGTVVKELVGTRPKAMLAHELKDVLAEEPSQA